MMVEPNQDSGSHRNLPASADSSFDRRPIRSRQTRWAEAVTEILVGWRISPNAISIGGMWAAIAAGGAFGLTAFAEGGWQSTCWLVAALLCQVRLLCNLFDGMVAIRRGVASPVGELYNEVPDRVSDAAVLIGLGCAAGGTWVGGYLAAWVALFVAYVRAVGKASGAPSDFGGPMAKPQRMAVVTALAVYMALGPWAGQWAWSEVEAALYLIIVGGLWTAVLRLRRIARHLRDGVG